MSTDPHLSPTRLAAADLTPAEAEHLAVCARCRVDRARAREFFDDPVADPPDRYEDRGLVSRGGMGDVRRVYDRQLQRVVAMKILHVASASTSASEDEQTWEIRFRREAEVLSRLDHPAIVPLYDRGVRPDGALYYTMRLVGGGTLEDRLAAARTLAERLALVPHFAAVCQAVAYAHRAGIVHRDLKPRNIMVGDFGETVVLDWGIAKVRGRIELGGGPAAVEPGATEVGTVLGTPGYMSPEQAEGRADDVDARADVWSLGAVLHEILTGEPPTPGPSLAGGPRTRAGPADLAAVAAKARSTVPGERYADAGELAAEVQAYLEGDRVRVYRYSSWELATRLVRQNRAAVGVALLAGIAVLAAAAQLVRTNAALEEARADEQRAGEATRRQLAGTLVERGMQEVQRDLPSLALPSFAGALRAVEGMPDDERAARVRLQVALAAAPRLIAVIPAELPEHIAMTPDGDYLAVATGSAVEVWDVNRAERVGLIDALSGIAVEPRLPPSIFTLAFGPDRRLAIRDRAGVTVWAVDGTRIAGPAPDPDPVHGSLEWMNDGALIRTSSALYTSPTQLRFADGFDSPARAWRVRDGQMRPVPLPPGALTLSPDGAWMVRDGGRGTHGEAQYEVAPVPSSSRTSIPAQGPLQSERRHPANMWFARNAPLAVSVGSEGNAVWPMDLRREAPRQSSTSESIGRPGEYLKAVSLSHDGQRVLAISDRTVALLITSPSWEGIAAAIPRQASMFPVAFAGGDPRRRVATADEVGAYIWEFTERPQTSGRAPLDREGRQWRLQNARAPALFDRSGEVVVQCATPEAVEVAVGRPEVLSGDGRTLFWRAGSMGNNLGSWLVHACDTATGRWITTFPDEVVEVRPASGAVLIASWDHATVYAEDLTTALWTGTGEQFRLSPDGRRVAVLDLGVDDGRNYRDIGAEECLRRADARRLQVHEVGAGNVHPIDVPRGVLGRAPDPGDERTCDRLLPTLPYAEFEWVGTDRLAFTDGPRFHVVDVVSGVEFFRDHSPGPRGSGLDDATVRQLYPDPAGRWVSTLDWGGRARVWRVADGEPMGPWIHLERLSSLSLDPTGRVLLGLGGMPGSGLERLADTHAFDVATGQWLGTWYRRATRVTAFARVEIDPALFEDLRPSPWPVADWIDLAEVISGERLDAPGERIPAEERAQRLRALRARYPEL